MALSVSRAVSSTAEPAFATDRDSTIVAWNLSAERFLGYAESEVLGKPCYEVLGGRDVFGNHYCGPNCPVYESALRGEPVTRFEVSYRAGKGGQVRTEVALLTLRGEVAEEVFLIHLLRPVLNLADIPPGGRASGSGIRRVGPSVSLTPRQTEVLKLLESGCGTQEIAERLFISEVTVRNHVENVLHRLEVHSRLEAVVAARLNGLL